MSDSTSIKLRDGLKQGVEEIAADESRTANWVMNEAIAEYVARKKQRKAYREEAREAHRHYVETGLHLTPDEVEDWMARRAKGERIPMPKLHT